MSLKGVFCQVQIIPEFTSERINYKMHNRWARMHDIRAYIELIVTVQLRRTGQRITAAGQWMGRPQCPLGRTPPEATTRGAATHQPWSSERRRPIHASMKRAARRPCQLAVQTHVLITLRPHIIRTASARSANAPGSERLPRRNSRETIDRSTIFRSPDQSSETSPDSGACPRSSAFWACHPPLSGR